MVFLRSLLVPVCLLAATCGFAWAEEFAPAQSRSSQPADTTQAPPESTTSSDPAAGQTAAEKPAFSGPGAQQYIRIEDPATASPWQLNFTQTSDYVTNLALPFSLTPLNGSVLRDDFQLQTKAGGIYQFIHTNETNFSVGYNYYQSLHPVVHQLDLISHDVGAHYQELVVDERLIVSLDYDYFYWFLDGTSLVSQHRAGLTALGKLNSSWDAKVAYSYLRADFRIDPTLTSDNNAVQMEFIRYLDEGRKHYFSGGYLYGRSDAVATSFSYTAHSPYVSLRFLSGENNQSELNIVGAYNDYNFDGFDLIQPTVHRVDEVWVLTPRYTRHVNKYLDLFGQYTLYNSSSTVIRQDYVSHLFSLGASLWY